MSRIVLGVGKRYSHFSWPNWIVGWSVKLQWKSRFMKGFGIKIWTANVCWRVYIPVAQRGRFWCCVLNCAGHVFCSVSTQMGNLSQVPLDTILVHGFLDVSSMKSVNLFRLLFFGNEMGLFRKVFFEKIPLNHLKSWTSMVFQWFPFNKTISLKPPGGGADPMSESLRQGS